MKSLLTKIIILIILLTTFYGQSGVREAWGVHKPGFQPIVPGSNIEININDPTHVENAITGLPLSRPIRPATSETQKNAIDDLTCISFIPPELNFGNCLIQGMLIPFKIAGYIVTAAGLMLDLSMDLSINKMAGLQQIPALIDAWSAFRDIANMLFIFAVLYIAISIILQLSGHGTRQMLAKVIVSGLLINFSFFFTGVIIDASNIITLGFRPRVGADIFAPPLGSGGISFSTIIQAKYDLQSILNAKDEANKSLLSNASVANGNDSTGIDGGNILLALAFGTGFMLITAFVYMAGAILFFIRLGVMLILLVTSPVAYIGGVLPSFGGISSKWWKALTNQALFAPAYMLLTGVALTIFLSNEFTEASFGTSGINKGFISIFTTQDPTALIESMKSVIGNFAVITVLMMSSLVMSAQLGAYGANKLVATGKRWGQKAARGAYGLGARSTVGKLANLADRKLGDTRFGNWRPIAALRKKTTGAVAETRFGGLASAKQTRERVKAEGVARKAKIEQINKEKEVLEASAILTPATAAALGTTMDGHDRRLSESLNRMNSSEIVNLVDKNKDLMKNNRFMAALSTQKFEALHNSDKFNTRQREGFRDARYSELREEVAAGNVNRVNDLMMRLPERELEYLSPETRANPLVVAAYRPQHIKTIQDSDKFATTEKNRIMAIRQEPITAGIANPNTALGSTQIRDHIKSRTDQELENLDHAFFANSRVVEQIPTAKFNKLIDSSRFTPQEKQQMRELRVGNLRILTVTPGANPAAIRDEINSITVPVIADTDRALLLQDSVVAQMQAADLADIDAKNQLTVGEKTQLGAAIRRLQAAGSLNPRTGAELYEYVTLGPQHFKWS